MARPIIDYLAKDYESFRQLMLDRLASTVPSWTERHAADFGMTMVETLAFAADRLSYRQDAVATEAYIGTARQRRSLRRHGRLIDYTLHEGCNARAWVQIIVRGGAASFEEIAYLGLLAGDEGAASSTQFWPLERGRRTYFERHNRMSVRGPLSAGATSAVIELSATPPLRAGMVLILEAAGDAAASRAQLHHPVQLTDATPIAGTGTWWITWHEADALPQSIAGAMAQASAVTALGNVVLVDHGGWQAGPEVKVSDARLRRTDLSFAARAPGTSASERLRQDPRNALACIKLTAPDGSNWDLQPDLLSSRPWDHHYCVERDDDGAVHLRFGDGVCGARPQYESFMLEYRTGKGAAGNVAAGAINRLAPRSAAATLVVRDHVARVSNPLPATGGSMPESARLMSLVAPGSIAVDQPRATVAADYERFARQVGGVQQAAATIFAEGARKLVVVAIDPLGFRAAPGDLGYPPSWRPLQQHVQRRLDEVRSINHEVAVVSPFYVEIEIELQLEIQQGYAFADVRGSVRRHLVERFSADNVTFGQSVRWSQIAASILRLPGVAGIVQQRFQRHDMPTVPLSGGSPIATIEIGPLEVAFINSEEVSLV